MPFSFFKWFKVGPAKIGVGKRGVSSIKVGRVTKSRGRSMRVSIPTGIPGLRFSLGGRRQRGRR
jgi:hypothetical protein